MDAEVDMTEAKSDRFGLEFGGGEGGITGAVRAAKSGGVAGKRKGRGKTTTNAKGKVVQVSGPGDEWDLEDYGGGDEGEGDLMDIGVRVGLPVCVTMNLVGVLPARCRYLTNRLLLKIPDSDRFFLDATTPEELACPSRLHLFFCSSPHTGRIVPTASLDQRKFNVCGIRVEGGEGLGLARLPTLLQVRHFVCICFKYSLGVLQVGEKIGKQMMIDLNASMNEDA